MSIVHENDMDWFLTCDKTHHEFSNVDKKGGATTGQYINESFP